MGERTIVVVVEGVEAAKTALLRSLHNIVRQGDLITLLHVFPSSSSRSKKKFRLRGFQLALSFKDICDNFPNTKIEIFVMEAHTIAAVVRETRASALVVSLQDQSFLYKVVTDEVSSTAISWPTEVRHVSRVTFDRFNGFLGLPVELETDVPRMVPSASASVFGVSAESIQCSYEESGKSVPTIFLMMQKRLYDEGGLQTEGIFRINGENSKEEYVRYQLNIGIVPREVDVHCCASLIKLDQRRPL